MEESLIAIDWDIFTAMDSEEELVDKAEDYNWQEENQITVMAGLIFNVGIDNVTEGCPGISQPTLTIRMNSSLVHDTTVFRER